MAEMPDSLMATGACSRDEPMPKVGPRDDQVARLDLLGEGGVQVLHAVLGHLRGM